MRDCREWIMDQYDDLIVIQNESIDRNCNFVVSSVFVCFSCRALELIHNSLHLTMWRWNRRSIYVCGKHHRRIVSLLLTWTCRCNRYEDLSLRILLLWIRTLEFSLWKVGWICMKLLKIGSYWNLWLVYLFGFFGRDSPFVIWNCREMEVEHNKMHKSTHWITEKKLQPPLLNIRLYFYIIIAV